MANIFQEQHLPRYRKEGYAYLATIPEVKRFLDTKLFETITCVREQIFATDLAILEFDVVASSLMPHPRAHLLKHGLVKRHNLLHNREPEDGIRQTIGFFGNRLQIALNFRSQAATSDNRD